MPEQPTKKRRRRGLSLRVLMAAVLVIGGGLGWWSYRARVQREAIDEITAAGGKVLYDWQDPSELRIDPTRRKPPPWPKWLVKALGVDYLSTVVAVYSVDSNMRTSGDALMKIIPRLGQLRRLRISPEYYRLSHFESDWSGGRYSDVANASLVHLRDLKWLEELEIRDAPGVTDAGLVNLQGLSRLKSLSLETTKVQGSGLVNLAGLTRLETLHLALAPTDADIAPLSGMVSLRSLELWSDRLTDQGLAHLRGLTNLKELSFQRRDKAESAITNAALAHLQGLQRLETLSLSGSSISDLVPLIRLPALKKLTLDKLPIDDAALAPLAGLPRLEKLSIAGTNITDAGLVHLARIKQLKALDLRQTQVCLEGIAVLRQSLPNISISYP
jgi:hypothetical protein